ncbi:hypothetical protein GQ53DRAFT_251163 [Thozetella sp. PMI_491]|nr:hypothetical protein GQ53DRAFT_251163 [Thozetella sp. PMI_491]
MAAALARQPSRFSVASAAPSYHTIAEGSGASDDLPGFDGDSTVDVNPPDSVLDSPPDYSPATFFAPTVFFQIETEGKKFVSLPIPLRPHPINVYSLTPAGTVTGTKFVSLRASRSSGNSTLVDGSDHSVVRSVTTYRFGPGRSPSVKLFSSPVLDGADDVLELDMAEGGSEAGEADVPGWDLFELKGRGILTRAIAFKTRLGTFEWRYAGKKERKAAGADSLLVLDRIVKVSLAQNQASSSASSASSLSRPNAKQDEVRTPVAHFVRNEECRTAGTSRASAGNGGRLMMDLGPWDEAQKTEREMAIVLAVSTCVSMLKKEVDRRRTQQMAVMVAVGSGAAA